MTLRVLVWPESSDGRPLEPEEPGWVIGWKFDDATVVCAGILPLQRDTLYTHMIVGQWQPTASKKKSSIPFFVSTKDGPWWKNDSAVTSEQQLLLYRRDVFYQHDTPWISGLFPKLLCYVNEASDVMGRLKQGESVTVEYKETTESTSDDASSPAKEERVDVTVEQSSLPGRLRRFVAKQSMLALHWEAMSGFFYQVPAVQLLMLLGKNGGKSGSDQGSSRDKIEAYIDRFNQAVSIALNSILGVVAGMPLFYYTNEILHLLHRAWITCYEELLRDNIQWLETFPAGFKLNVPLTQNMGREITMLIGIHDSICGMLWSSIPKSFILQVVGVASMVFGFTALIALVHDILILSTLHIAAVATCFRVMHQTQLYLLTSLWRLFRGRKRNILRHRTDTMEYDFMQLLLGMILFTAVLFLFTTILVYYAFFAVLHLAIQGIGVVLWLLYVITRFIPLGKCVMRAKYPGWFTESVYLEDVLSASRTVLRLTPAYRSYVSILSNPLAEVFALVVSSIPRYIGEVLAGKPSSIREVCVSSASYSMKQKSV